MGSDGREPGIRDARQADAITAGAATVHKYWQCLGSPVIGRPILPGEESAESLHQKGFADRPRMVQPLPAADTEDQAVKRVVIVAAGTLVVAMACTDANAQGRGRGHLKHAGQSGTSEYREIVLPSGTPLRLSLTSPVASDSNKVEDQVRAVVREPVVVDRQVVLPRGTPVIGYVSDVDRSGRVKGRGHVEMRFSRLMLDGDQYNFRSEPVDVVADGTKGEDAAKIGLGTGAGAALGAILDGASGATKGAVLGGAAGTGVVLATRGDEVRLDAGHALDTRLTASLPVRVPIR